MLKRSVKHLSWWSLMLAMLLGIVILGLRFGLPKLSDYPEEIAEFLGESLGLNLGITGIDARWEGYYPTLALHELRVFSAGEQGPEVRLSVGRIKAKLDPWRSLLRFQPIFETLEFDTVNGVWRQREGHWLHRPGVGQDGSGMSELGWQRFLGLVLSQPRVGIADARLLMIPDAGVPRELESINALIENVDEQHQLSGSLSMGSLGEDTRLQFAVQLEGTPEDPLKGDYPFYLKLDSLGPELFNLVDMEMPLIRLRAGTEFWGRWHAGSLQWLQGALAVGDLEYGASPNRLLLDNSHLDFALLPKPGGYQLQLNNIHLNTEGTELVVPQLVLEGGGLQSPFRLQRVQLPELALAPMVDWLLSQEGLPEEAVTNLQALKPEGYLRNLSIEWPEGGDWQAFELRGDASDLSVQGYYGAPAVTGVFGRLEANIGGGELHLKSDALGLHFPKLYDRGWSFTKADGVVRWKLTPGSALVHSDLLHLADAGVKGAGRFSIDIPYDRMQQTELTLLIGITDGDGSRAQSFTPVQEVGQGLYTWLGSSVEAGTIRQAGLLLHGGTRVLESKQRPSVQLFFDIGQARLKYDPDWPAIDDGDLFLYIHNGDLRVDIRSATLLDSKITSGWAYKPLHHAGLQVVTQVEGPAADLEQVLRSKPLKSVGEALDDWHLSGNLDTRLKLLIPVQGNGAAKLNVDASGRLDGGRLASDSMRLNLEGISGALRYSTRSGLSGDGLKGWVLGQAVTGRIRTHDGVTRVDFQGGLPMEVARRWTGVEPLGLIRGTLDYTAALLLCNERPACVSRFELNSDLQGVAVDLPAPLLLTETQPGALELQVALASKQLDFNYGQALKGRFDLAGGGLRGTLHLGEGDARLRADRGLYVDGALGHLDVAELMDLLERLEQLEPDVAEGRSVAAGESGVPPGRDEVLKRVELTLDEVQAGGELLSDVHAIVTPESGGWLLQLEGPDIAGDVRIPESDRPLSISLTHLAFGQQTQDGNVAEERAEATLDQGSMPSPESIRAADLQIGKLIYNGRDWGRWQAELRPDGRRLKVGNIRAELAQFQLSGELDWLGGAHPHTGLTMKITGRDIGRQLEHWGLEKAVESEELTSDLQLEWSGAPWSARAMNLDGTLKFRFKEGRLIESGNSANLLRVFGILNFNTLGRRLRLDFSDLFKKGVVFDRLEGRYGIEDGVATTLDPLVMEGPSANLKATGSLNFVDETVNKEMEVVLPLTSNVPFAAVLLGAPQVAGAVFLIDKLIGDKLEKVTTLKYSISGDWSEPQVELQTGAAPQAN